METAMTQIKINLPVVLKKKIKARADEWGLSLASYIKHLIVTKVEEYPTFEASDRTKKIIEKAIKDDKWIEVKDVDEYFAKLKK